MSVNYSHGKFQARVKEKNGKVHTKLFNTKKEAKEYERKLYHDLQRSSFSFEKNNTLFSDFFLNFYIPEVCLSDTQGWRDDKARQYRNYIANHIGHKKIKDIKLVDITFIINRMREKKLAPQTILHIYNTLNHSFKAAIEYDYLSESPMRKSIKPKLEKREGITLTPHESNIVIQSSKGHKFELAVLFQLLAGLRVGEVIGLRWKNLRIDQDFLIISEAFAKKENRMRDTTKTKEERFLPLHPYIKTIIKDKIAKIDPEFFVLTSSEKNFSYNSYLRFLKSIVKANNLNPQIATHALRHGHAELMSVQGANIHEVQYSLGHRKSETTKGYLHSHQPKFQACTKLINQIILPAMQKETLVPTSEVNF